MNHYEQTALVFYSEKNFFMSYNLFLDALAIEKDNSMLWYGLGDSLCAYSVQKKVEKFHRIGIACIKKSLELNPENEYSTEMIARLKVDPSISEDYISKISTLTFEQAIRLRIKIPTKKLIDNFQRLRSPDDQIKAIKQLGDSENTQFAPLLAHCIIHSENENVRFAALKRIHKFQDKFDLKPIFETIISKDKIDENEPYFSMSIRRVNTGWARKLSATVGETSNINDEVDESILATLAQDEDLYVTLNTLLFSPDELKSLIAADERKKIGKKISMYMKPDVVRDLSLKGIMDKQGSFTALGIALLNRYLGKISTASKTNNNINEAKIKETIGAKEIEPIQKTNWWKIWK